MQFHQSDPSIVWRFGCRSPREGLPEIERQFRNADRYYNNLIALERDRRGKVEAKVREHSPLLESLIQSVETLAAEIRELRAEIKTRNAKQRKRTGKEAEREAVASLEERITQARAWLTEERLRLWGKSDKDHPENDVPGDADFLAEIAAINAAANERKKALRGGCGCYWGTYLLVERAVQQATSDSLPDVPGFRHWPGAPPGYGIDHPPTDPDVPYVKEAFAGTKRLIGVQLQGGLSVAEALACEDQRLRIEMQSGHKSSRGQNGTLWLRIGSEGRNPLWAKVAFRLHRPLPQDAVIKWVTMTCETVGGYPEWHANVTLSRKSGWAKPDRTGKGRVAVNLGWRSLPNGTLRVATWQDEQGKRGELAIGERDLRRWTKADSLRSIRDRNFNEVVGVLLEFRSRDNVPEWFRLETRSMALWRNHGNLSRLLGMWTHQRFDGDEEQFTLVEGWLEQAIHLWKWEENARKEAVDWRKKLYQQLAAHLRRTYVELRIAKADYSKLARRANPEDEREAAQLTRFRRTIASSGLLAQLLKESFGTPNAIEVPAKDLTQRCHACGHNEKWDAAPEVRHVCAACGVEWDQDFGHCENLLAWVPPPPKKRENASGEVVDENPDSARGTEDDEATGDRAAG